MSNPGWYDDPHDASAHRWWDGLAWTHHTRGKVQSVPPGWYEPVTRPGELWWWNGSEWTEENLDYGTVVDLTDARSLAQSMSVDLRERQRAAVGVRGTRSAGTGAVASPLDADLPRTSAAHVDVPPAGTVAATTSAPGMPSAPVRDHGIRLAPGWYDTPDHPGYQRWWDGQSWSSERVLAPIYTVGEGGWRLDTATPRSAPVISERTHRLRTAALVCLAVVGVIAAVWLRLTVLS